VQQRVALPRIDIHRVVISGDAEMEMDRNPGEMEGKPERENRRQTQIPPATPRDQKGRSGYGGLRQRPHRRSVERRRPSKHFECKDENNTKR
jgi:hypothetical protein